jgi:thiol:disulfide interchange protein DsbA
MKTFRSLLITTLLCAFTIAGAHAASAGHDYVPVLQQQPVDNPAKAEVLEVFSYACPHCAHLAPEIEPWAKKLPSNVVFKRVPITFGRPQWEVLSRTYFALDNLHEADRLHEKIFVAMHQQHINLTSLDEMTHWLAGQGVDTQKFMAQYNSFAVQSKVNSANNKAMALGVDSVPSVIVNGKYKTAPSMFSNTGAFFATLDDLIKMR